MLVCSVAQLCWYRVAFNAGTAVFRLVLILISASDYSQLEFLTLFSVYSLQMTQEKAHLTDMVTKLEAQVQSRLFACT